MSWGLRGLRPCGLFTYTDCLLETYILNYKQCRLPLPQPKTFLAPKPLYSGPLPCRTRLEPLKILNPKPLSPKTLNPKPLNP